MPGGLSYVRMTSASDKSRIQTACNGGVVVSLNNGPTVGKKGHLIGITPELQDKCIVLDSAMYSQPSRHFSEIHRAVALMDLHRVPAAQRDLWPALARQVNEFPLFACLAAGARPGSSNLSLLVVPNVERE